MEIKYLGHKLRTQKSMERWVQMASDYNAGIPVSELRLSKKYTNPRTGKPFSRAYFYWVFDRLKNIPVTNL